MNDEKKVGNGHVLECEKGLRMVPTILLRSIAYILKLKGFEEYLTT